jgi:3',5'-cyclic AMP phosphodiesterase CpdA
MRFIVLGDLHYAVYADPAVSASRDRFFEGFFRQVVAQQADLVFAIGDTTDRGTIAELTGQTALAKRCGLDLIRLIGNHDAYSLDKAELAPYFLGNYAPASSTELYTGFDSGPVRFVLLDTARSRDDNWSGFVSDEQLAWLDAQIEQFNQAAQPRHLIVMGHHPIFNTTRRSDTLWLNIDNSPAVQEVFTRLTRRPGVYVCGHNHSNSLAGPDEQGWYYTQLGAPLVCRSYGLFTLDEHGIRFETVDINLSDPQMQADLDITRFAISEDFNEHPFEERYGATSDHFMQIPVSYTTSA